MIQNITQHSVIESNKLHQIMSYCYGTENYYKIPQYSFKYTDGVKMFCEKADAYWLLDLIESIPAEYQNTIAGWTDKGIGHRLYGRTKDIKVMLKELSKISYPLSKELKVFKEKIRTSYYFKI